MRNNGTFRLIDVRESHEWDICRLESAELLPMSTVDTWLGNLDPAREYVFYCHHGNRSNVACSLALSRGIRNVANLVGGIDAWSVAIDPAVARY